MYRKLLFACILSLFSTLAHLTSVMAADSGVIVLCYHDVVEKPYNALTITPAALKEHFEYLKRNGYHPISLDQYIAACKKGTSLPDKPILLSFDDGYESFYTKILPLLKQYNYPAVYAIVTSWSEYAPPDVGKVLSWQQIRDMEKSGLISLASHSHQSHRSVITNPQGDSGNMIESRQYISGQYESLEVYRQRVKSDFKQTQAIFEKELGHKVRAMVWPYGAYTKIAIDIGHEEGFEAFFGLDGGFNPRNELGLSDARRGMIDKSIQGEQFAKFIKAGAYKFQNIKAAQLDMDQIYVPSNANETEHNLKLAVERFNAAGINTVYLKAFSDPKNTGNIESVYFNTKEAPVKADIFSHIAVRLRSEGFCVYAWMPTVGCQWLAKDQAESKVSSREERGKYNVATPFSPIVQKRLEALYSDLAAYSYIDGILFQDDLYLKDYEDFSPAAKKSFHSATGRELTPEILKDNAMRAQWMQVKSKGMTDLTKQLTAAMYRYRPYLKTARKLDPPVTAQANSQEWLAENYNQYMSAYDYTIIMAAPHIAKQHDKSIVCLDQFVSSVLLNKDNTNKTIFQLQTYERDQKQWLSSKELNQQRDILISKKAIHFAYTPENVIAE